MKEKAFDEVMKAIDEEITRHEAAFAAGAVFVSTTSEEVAAYFDRKGNEGFVIDYYEGAYDIINLYAQERTFSHD